VGLDSYFALIAPALVSAYGTFLLRQFLLTIPRELDEAARMDGATHWQTFSRIILPLARPGLATLAIFTFMGTWSNLLWPVVVTNLEALFTLPLGMQEFQSQGGTEWHLMMGASLLMILPVVVIFIAGQRHFIRGLTMGAVKG
jgi:multiple sugar transport system permease protein